LRKIGSRVLHQQQYCSQSTYIRLSALSFAYNLRFPGQIFDGQAGLHQNGYRDFDPAVGKYVESDPIGLAGGSYSLYNYAGARALLFSDPLGLWGTDAHHAILHYAFPDLPGAYLDRVMAGSDSVDSILNQFGDTNYMHAMRGKNETPEDARRKACDFVNMHMQQYQRLMKLSNVASVFRVEAYEQLGMALHPIMDSTSPMHEGRQAWDPWNDWVWHGDAHGSPEGLDALTAQKMRQTQDLIKRAMNGNTCFCQKRAVLHHMKL
jgi:RHS repeat-associated protein